MLSFPDSQSQYDVHLVSRNAIGPQSEPKPFEREAISSLLQYGFDQKSLLYLINAFRGEGADGLTHCLQVLANISDADLDSYTNASNERSIFL